MITAFTSGGQLGNQLMFEANLLASALDTGLPHTNLSFAVGRDFVCLPPAGCRVTYAPRRCFILRKYMGGMHRLFRRAPGITEVLEDPERALAVYRQPRRVLFHGWPYLDLPALARRQEEVRRRLYPRDDVRRAAEEFVRRHRAPDTVLIAVHIRGGDYRTFFDGRYAFPTEVYRRRMAELAALYAPAPVKFLIFSDGTVAERDFASLPFPVAVSHGSAAVDMTAMSLCDAIVGAPSTFSGFASFMGNVPKYILLSDTPLTDRRAAGVYMIGVMDDLTDANGAKVLSYLQNGERVTGGVLRA